jgi:hypothetical protein
MKSRRHRIFNVLYVIALILYGLGAATIGIWEGDIGEIMMWLYFIPAGMMGVVILALLASGLYEIFDENRQGSALYAIVWIFCSYTSLIILLALCVNLSYEIMPTACALIALTILATCGLVEIKVEHKVIAFVKDMKSLYEDVLSVETRTVDGLRGPIDSVFVQIDTNASTDRISDLANILYDKIICRDASLKYCEIFIQGTVRRDNGYYLEKIRVAAINLHRIEVINSSYLQDIQAMNNDYYANKNKAT